MRMMFVLRVVGWQANRCYMFVSARARAQFLVRVRGEAIDVPVWLPRREVDLRLCAFDRLYQDTVLVKSRAATALKLDIVVPPELRGHLELLPRTGYVQAHADFPLQLKFLPTPALADVPGIAQYLDTSTGVLNVPLTILVAGQTYPVEFAMHAAVTSTELELDTHEIDFGAVTICETARRRVTLTNRGILPQRFGCVGLPAHVSVQPNDGFGVLLPLETVQLDVLFSPDRANDYAFTITVKNLYNNATSIRCRGVGVHPPLQFSEQVLQFPATTLYDTAVAHLFVRNTHTNMNEFKQPVPRIGAEGQIAPVGPTSFEFLLPPDLPIRIAPLVGCVMPGEARRRFCLPLPSFLCSCPLSSTSPLMSPSPPPSLIADTPLTSS